jgi:orotidine-5'-phosphate decarboxylase
MANLIVALDFPNEKRALELVGALDGLVDFYKVGLQLFTASGPEIVRKIRGLGARVFLDLKFLDIPNTVAQAALEGARLGADMMTFHALGGERTLRAASDLLRERSQQEAWQIPKLLGVTVLTSMDQASLSAIGIDRPLDAVVLHLARIVQRSGFDGVVCSPQEVRQLRDSGLTDLLLVTPGIRAAQSGADDQARAATAGQAVRDGADYLVVGRPITQAEDPIAAAGQILQEIEDARMERA